jgi:sortase A
MTKRKFIAVFLIVASLFLGYIAYEAFTTPEPTRKPDIQSILDTQIPSAIPGPPPTARAVEDGKALALMEIPRFDKDWMWTTLEGTKLSTLNKGPGHYTGTPLPGEEGNSAFAAHRATHGDPFIDFPDLRVGDKVLLSQVGAKWTYEITQEPKIISAKSQWVLDKFAPGKWLTLTTCWPKYGSSKRMYVRAELVKVETTQR